MVKGKFGSNSGLDDLCLYDIRQNELIFLRTNPLEELDSVWFGHDESSTPIRYDAISSGNFSNGAQSGLALLSSDTDLESIWFRDESNPLDRIWKIEKEWSWITTGDFLQTGTEQALLHRLGIGGVNLRAQAASGTIPFNISFPS